MIKMKNTTKIGLATIVALATVANGANAENVETPKEKTKPKHIVSAELAVGTESTTLDGKTVGNLKGNLGYFARFTNQRNYDGTKNDLSMVFARYTLGGGVDVVAGMQNGDPRAGLRYFTVPVKGLKVLGFVTGNFKENPRTGENIRTLAGLVDVAYTHSSGIHVGLEGSGVFVQDGTLVTPVVTKEKVDFGYENGSTSFGLTGKCTQFKKKSICEGGAYLRMKFNRHK
jgi:hypothetical protein